MGAPLIRHYAPGEYNAHRQNWAIAQDNRGVMYFGNGNGLLEFDGNSWRYIKMPNYSLVRSLDTDSNGTLYIGAANEFGHLVADKQGNCSYISLSQLLPNEEKNFKNVWDTNATSHGIYFRSRHKIFRYFQGKIQVIPVTTISSSVVLYGSVIVSKSSGGIFVLKDGILRMLPYTRHLTIKNNERVVVSEYPDNKLFIATRKSGNYLYDLGSFVKNGSFVSDFSKVIARSSILKKFPLAFESFLVENEMFSNTRLTHNRYALGTRFGGLAIMDMHGKLLHIINQDDGFHSNLVRFVFQDHHQNLWAATNNGITYMETDSPISIYNRNTGPRESVLTMEHHNGKLYIGAHDNIYYLPNTPLLKNGIKNRILSIPGRNSSYWELIKVKKRLFAGGRDVIIQILDSRIVKTRVKELIYAMGYSPKLPNILFLGGRRGFQAMKIQFPGAPVDGASLNVPVRLIPLPEDPFKKVNYIIRRIACDSQGDLWVTTRFNGIIYIKFNSKHILDFKIHRYTERHGLPRLDWARVFFIQGRMIVATPRGLFRGVLPTDFNTNLDGIRFVPETAFEKRFHDGSVDVTQMVQVSKNEIWLNTSIGVGALTGSFEKGFTWDDTAFKKIGKGMFFIDPMGIAWVGGNNGLYRIDRGIKKDYSRPYNALIRRVVSPKYKTLFNGRFYDPCISKDRFFPVTSPVQPPDTVSELPYKYNSILFEYAAAFYEHPDSNQFQYFLEGFDKEWSNWSGLARKEYTNLPGGHYRFKIKAKNIFDLESKEAVYSFRVLPPWYFTIYAKIGFALMLLVIILIALKIHVERVRKIIIRERKKYGLWPKITDDYAHSVLKHMKKEKPYLDTSFTLSELSKNLGIPVYQLSHIINEKFNKNFNEFINNYRIDEAKLKLSDPQQNQANILTIAYEVGFNSKSSFNIAFKKNTGMTPSQFKKKSRAERANK